MIRFSTIRKMKCPLALGVIISFALVFACDLLCDMGHISFAPTIPTVLSANSHNHHRHENEQDPHGSSTTAGHDHNSHSHEGDKRKRGACCNDITQQFYSSLVSSSGASLGSLIHAEAFKVINAFILPDILRVGSFKGLQVISTYAHYSNGPPGGKVGQHIIILFCTFLI